MKVAHCIPCYRYPKPKFLDSALRLATWSMRQRWVVNDQQVPFELEHIVAEGLPVELAREKIAETALTWGADYLLWTDDDHVFPPDSLARLMKHDLDAVGCNYQRRRDGVSTAGEFNGGQWVPLEPKAAGVEAVQSMGFGMLLLKAPVFAGLPKPWFEMRPNGEDRHFCRLLRERGIQPYVDHSLSMEVGHIAETVLTFPR